MHIREAVWEDFEAIWPIFHEIVCEGTTYSFPRDTSKEEARKLWMEIPRATYVIEVNNEILGTYYIKANQVGSGSHICNCGYMVSSKARGQGLASQMCKHSQETAIRLGYKGMQFNFVVSTNVVAVNLWKKLGYEIVGRLPKACNHPVEGYVDALIMYKWFNEEK